MPKLITLFLCIFICNNLNAKPCSDVFPKNETNPKQRSISSTEESSDEVNKEKLNKITSPTELKAQIAELFAVLQKKSNKSFLDIYKMKQSTFPLPSFVKEEHSRSELINIHLYLQMVIKENVAPLKVENFLNASSKIIDRLLKDCLNGDPLGENIKSN